MFLSDSKSYVILSLTFVHLFVWCFIYTLEIFTVNKPIVDKIMIRDFKIMIRDFWFCIT